MVDDIKFLTFTQILDTSHLVNVILILLIRYAINFLKHVHNKFIMNNFYIKFRKKKKKRF